MSVIVESWPITFSPTAINHPLDNFNGALCYSLIWWIEDDAATTPHAALRRQAKN
jgi:hypothetical protein